MTCTFKKIIDLLNVKTTWNSHSVKTTWNSQLHPLVPMIFHRVPSSFGYPCVVAVLFLVTFTVSHTIHRTTLITYILTPEYIRAPPPHPSPPPPFYWANVSTKRHFNARIFHECSMVISGKMAMMKAIMTMSVSFYRKTQDTKHMTTQITRRVKYVTHIANWSD